MPAAIATADVSDPPRPSVVMRPVSLCTPWKPAITATSRLRSLKRLISSAPLISTMRALPWALEVWIGTCQPCQERAVTPSACNAMASRPEVTCSPDATTASYSRASCSSEASRHHCTSWLVVPAMAETTTATSWPASTVDQAEVERFSRLAAEWWNPRGKMAPLHKFNPLRLAYIRDQAAVHFRRDAKRLDSLKELRILDIGCGGGLLSEPLARLGA